VIGQTWNDFNTPKGLMNREIAEIFDVLVERTGRGVHWIKPRHNDPSTEMVSYTTRKDDGFRVDIALTNGEISASITNIINPDIVGEVAGKLAADYPPESGVRAVLAGKAFRLFELARVQEIL
jgi:hypothetical protein